MSESAAVPLRVTKINAGKISRQDDLLACEEPLEIRLSYGDKIREQKSISVTMRTPGNDAELAAGFLFTEGIIRTATELNGIHESGDNIICVELSAQSEPDLQKLERNFYTTSSCGVCGKSSIEAVRLVIPGATVGDDLKITADLFYTLPPLLREAQQVFDQTGGLHASALFDTAGKLLMLREDVGRHNALDKLIGAALMEGRLPLSKHILLLSGRASFELIQKAAMAGIKIVAAVGAPSTLAVEMAEECGMTLAGFLRDNRFNIYSGENRIATGSVIEHS